MGNTCTHSVDALANLVTEDQIHQAVKGIEEWQKSQANGIKNGAGQAQNQYGSLLQRVGGIDVVKKVVELFYKKLYADPHLIKFLRDQDVMHLRAKQSAFVSWLFGPPNTPYVGKSVRIAHLRIIKQRGFCPEDFDLGMKYFEEAMRELGAPENLMGEVMRRMWPFKDAFFTASPKDAEEEARWVAEERAKQEEEARAAEAQHAQEAAAQHQQEIKNLIAHYSHSTTGAAPSQSGAIVRRASQGSGGVGRRNSQTSSTGLSAAAPKPSTSAALSLAGESAASDGAAEVAAVFAAARHAVEAATVVHAPVVEAVAEASASRPASTRGPQCPFTGGHLSRPVSAALPAPAAAAAAPAAAGSRPSSRAASAKQPDLAAGAAVAAAAAAATERVLTPPKPTEMTSLRSASPPQPAAMASPSTRPGSTAVSVVPDPATDFEAALESIEQEVEVVRSRLATPVTGEATLSGTEGAAPPQIELAVAAATVA